MIPMRPGKESAHIANAEKIKALESICKSEGYELPVICTPEEFSERS